MSAAPDKWRPSLGLVIFAVLLLVPVLAIWVDDERDRTHTKSS